MSQADPKQVLLMLIHELRYITHTIKATSEILSKATSGKDKVDVPTVKHHSDVIFYQAYLLSLWLDIAEFEYDPTFFEQAKIQPRSLYGKFHKATLAFKPIAQPNRIRINVTGDARPLLDAYPVIDILPFILLDNAVKYSPPDSSVDIEFMERADYIQVAVSSVGPAMSEEEQSSIFQDGFRGENARKVASQGLGKGLAIAKTICELHGATISAECKRTLFRSNEIPYALFDVRMTFPKES